MTAGAAIEATGPVALVLGGLALAACTSPAGERPMLEPPLHPLPPGMATAPDPIDVYDPFEPVNRRIYVFNAFLDHYLLLPAVDAYQYVTPDFVEARVSNFFNNLTEIRNGVNSALQLKRESTGVALYRFFVNSTLGMFGMFDVATALGYPARPEDFGQTLGYWGVDQGPYVVLPVLGPSTARDTAGFATDTTFTNFVPPASYVSDEVYFHPSVLGLYVVDQRAQNAFRYYQSGSPFEYSLVRYLYIRKRAFDVAQ